MFFLLDWNWQHIAKGRSSEPLQTSSVGWGSSLVSEPDTSQPVPQVLGIICFWHGLGIVFWMNGQSTQVAALVVFQEPLRIHFGNHWPMLIYLASAELQREETWTGESAVLGIPVPGSESVFQRKGSLICSTHKCVWKYNGEPDSARNALIAQVVFKPKQTRLLLSWRVFPPCFGQCLMEPLLMNLAWGPWCTVCSPLLAGTAAGRLYTLQWESRPIAVMPGSSTVLNAV